MKLPLAIALSFAFALPAAAQGSDADHRRIYEKVRPSIVAIRALAPLGERSGTGTIIDKNGLILTSYSVVPDGSTKIRVWTEGPRRYDAEIVGTSKRDELTLIRIKPKGELAPIEFGESGRIRVGEVSYTIGNAANSIILDDQPSFNVGVISGLYKLTEPRANSTYTGIVLETTAAVNVGMEGAPLLNAEGRMVGFVTLNYSPNRFLGSAIPIDSQKYVIAQLTKKADASTSDPMPEVAGTLGLKAKDDNGRVVVTEVAAGSAADRAGLRAGTVILAVGRNDLRSCADLWKRLEGMRAGEILILKVEDDGDVLTIKVELTEK